MRCGGHAKPEIQALTVHWGKIFPLAKVNFGIKLFHHLVWGQPAMNYESYLLFTLDGSSYGLPATAVQEIFFSTCFNSYC